MASQQPNRLPGFGLPLNHVPDEQDEDYFGELYPNALSFSAMKAGQVVCVASSIYLSLTAMSSFPLIGYL